ncbi:GDP-fucose synthetase [Campylobacter devanensis]|nr:NAD-dependent epimerase/dehydratase family protein [Campylobacter lanienae]SUX01473.1 GDP-fucose synthetase [Campylobacter lanienae]
MDKNSKIYISGHRGLVGSAIIEELQKQGYANLIYKTHNELDLINQKAVNEFLNKKNLIMYFSVLLLRVDLSNKRNIRLNFYTIIS